MARTDHMRGWRNSIARYGEEAPEQLLAHPRNFRIHPKNQQQALEGALNDLGWLAPVIVNEVTSHVIDGHLRIELAISRGEKSVPVAYVNLSEAEEVEALLTFDPIGAMAATDKTNLDALLRDVATGEAAVQAMLAELAKDSGLDYGKEPKEAPEPQVDRAAELQAKWQTASGQVWSVGRHRLMCGDSTSAEDVARLMGEVKAEMVLTDPPYGMDLDTDWSGAVGQLTSVSRQHQTTGKQYERVIGDAAPFDPAPIFTAFGYCKEMFLWGADYYAERIPARTEGSWLVWDKRKESQAEAIGSEFELCWSKAKHKRRMLRHDWFGFLSSQNTKEAQNRLHPTQKPTSLLADIMQQWSKEGAVVADLYLGSGATMAAAEQTGRVCYGMEIEPKYVAVALERLAGMGLSPVLA